MLGLAAWPIQVLAACQQDVQANPEEAERRMKENQEEKRGYPGNLHIENRKVVEMDALLCKIEIFGKVSIASREDKERCNGHDKANECKKGSPNLVRETDQEDVRCKE